MPTPSTPRKSLIVVSLRGGVDGLNVLVPYRDDDYYRARPTIAIPGPSTPRGAAIDLDGMFGLHPALAPLFELFDSGRLAFVNAVGWPGDSHSHFEAWDEIESGSTGSARPSTGWLARYLAATSEGARSPLRSIAFADTLPRLLVGEPGAMVTRTLPTHFVAQEPEVDKRMRAALRRIYGDGTELGIAAVNALAAWDSVDAEVRRDGARSQPKQGNDATFAEQLRAVAVLQRSDVGLRAASVDLHGWDTHVAQGGVSGTMAERLADLAEGLRMYASNEDLFDRTIVIVLTEFGRRVAENGGAGTDHGSGSTMMILGGPIRGGRVYGRWPGLAATSLSGPGDLAVTTDIRDVIIELLVEDAGDRIASTVFPSYRPGARHGIVR